MGITLAKGTTLSIAQTLAAAKVMSAITNATEAVATLEASHGVAVGEYFMAASGWGRLDNTVQRAKTVATNDVTIEGFNSSSTSLFPAGSGVGSVREISTWQQITQIKGISSSGGEQKFEDITELDDDEDIEIPTTRGAIKLDLVIHDDPTLAWYATVKAAALAQTLTPFKFAFPNGSILVGAAYFNLREMPEIETRKALVTRLSMSLGSRPTRFAS